MNDLPRTALSAYLSYSDAPAALGWLQAVGFQVTARQDAPDGTVTHAEARLGNAVVMVASAPEDYLVPPLLGQSTGGGLYLGFDGTADVDEWFARAVAAGGVAVIAPEDTAWGARRARVLDPEGREWSAGTYLPGGPA